MKTHLVSTPLSGVVIVDIDHFQDERGFFIESWHQRDFAAEGLDLAFVQEGHSRSQRGVLRGLHHVQSGRWPRLVGESHRAANLL